MSNTGTFCIFVDSRKRAVEIKNSLVEYVLNDITLHNLSTTIVPAGDADTPVVIVGVLDDLTPANFKKFLKARASDVLATFVVNSIYGDNWEMI